MQYIVKRISEMSPGEDATIVTGVGQHQMWAAQHMKFKTRPHQLITSGGLGTMGFEVPAAVGAQVARPGEVVVGRSAATAGFSR